MQVRNMLLNPFHRLAVTWLQYVSSILLRSSNRFSDLAVKPLVFFFSKSAGGYDCASLANRIRLCFAEGEIHKNQKQQTGSTYLNMYFHSNKAEGNGLCQITSYHGFKSQTLLHNCRGL